MGRFVEERGNQFDKRERERQREKKRNEKEKKHYILVGNYKSLCYHFISRKERGKVGEMRVDFSDWQVSSPELLKL